MFMCNWRLLHIFKLELIRPCFCLHRIGCFVAYRNHGKPPPRIEVWVSIPAILILFASYLNRIDTFHFFVSILQFRYFWGYRPILAQVVSMLMLCSKVVGISVAPVLTNLVVESWQIQRFNICHMLRFDISLVQAKKIRKVHKRRLQTVNTTVIRLSLQIVSQEIHKE